MKPSCTAPSRRKAIKLLSLSMGYVATMIPLYGCREKKLHIITLSFDDGFAKSSIKTAEIYEKYGLSACINVIATAHEYNYHLPNEKKTGEFGDFNLWNDLKSRGHEIMPHSYNHTNLTKIPFEDAKELIMKCMDVFREKLTGFNAEESIYNFAYNASTPEIEEWLTTQVRAFRTGGPAINSLPYKGQKKLTCISHGPQNIDKHLDETINGFLEGQSGWLIYNTHGLDEEGWGPVSSVFLDELIDKLSKTKTVKLLPVGKALDMVK